MAQAIQIEVPADTPAGTLDGVGCAAGEYHIFRRTTYSDHWAGVRG